MWWRNDWVRVEYFPRTHFIGAPEDTERPARLKHWTWRFWRSNHLHVNVQCHRMDKESKFWKYFKFQKKSRSTPRDSREDTGHSSALETKRSGMEFSATYLKENGFHRRTVGETIQRNLSRKKKMSSYWRETARSKFFGANSKEWWSSIWKQIARMSSEIWKTGEREPICKSLRRCVILEKSLFFWDRAPACREYTHPRADSILGRPVLQVHIIQFLGTHGIEIQVPSTTSPNRSFWLWYAEGRIATWMS